MMLQPSPSAPVTLVTEVDQVRGDQIVNRSSVAGLAFLTWDICITFRYEVELVWSQPWNWSTALFAFVRYFPLLIEISLLLVGTELTPRFHFTSHACFAWQVLQGVASIALIMSVDIILIMRVYALYERSKWIATILLILFVFEILTMLVSLVFALPHITYNTICQVLDVPNTLLIYGAASVIFQIGLFVLTSIKFVAALRSRTRETTLVSLLMRDGTWAFGLIFLIIILQAMIYLIPNHSGYAGIFYYWFLSIFSFCGYRILLNLRHLGCVRSRSQSHLLSMSSPGFLSTARAEFTTVDSDLAHVVQVDEEASLERRVGSRLADGEYGIDAVIRDGLGDDGYELRPVRRIDRRTASIDGTLPAPSSSRV